MSIELKNYRVRARQKSRPLQMAYERYALFRVEEAVQRASAQTPGRTKFTATPSLCIQSPCAVGDLSRHGCAGKDGAIGHVLSGVNPEGCEVFSFKQPSAEELKHDFLWRTTCRLPERGRIGIFNRLITKRC